jgi:hypothetical protein
MPIVHQLQEIKPLRYRLFPKGVLLCIRIEYPLKPELKTECPMTTPPLLALPGNFFRRLILLQVIRQSRTISISI